MTEPPTVGELLRAPLLLPRWLLVVIVVPVAFSWVAVGWLFGLSITLGAILLGFGAYLEWREQEAAQDQTTGERAGRIRTRE